MMRREGWITLGVLAIGLPIAAVVGFALYVTSRPPLYSSATEVTSVTRSSPLPQWAGAAELGRAAAREGLVRQNVPGVSVAVGVAGQIVWAEGFGLADLANRTPVTPETRFRIGHVSKAITSAGVGTLIESGQLDLEEVIQTYVPAFPQKEWPITLRQLMGHVAGIHHYVDTEWGDKPTEHCERAAEGLARFAKDPLLFAPDSEYRYSTYGWVLVSAAVEAASGEPFSQFIRTKIFEPLGMSRTSFDAPRESVPERAVSYFRSNLNHEVNTSTDYSCFAGGGAMLSTASDLVRFGMAFNSGRIVKPETARTLQTRQLLASGQDTEYGLGWNLETVELAGARTLLASHASRTIEGASTSFLTFPERGMVVAVTSNMSFAAMREISWVVADAFAKAAGPAPVKPLRSGS